MSKQLKPNEWIELFDLYVSNNCKNLWIEYAKYKKFLYHSKLMNSLISVTSNTTKKCSKVARYKNTQDKHEIWKELL